MMQFIKDKFQKGNIAIWLILTIGVSVMVVVGVIPSLVGLGQGTSVQKSLNYLGSQGYYAYANPQGFLHADGLILSGAPPLTLEDSAKVWVEFRPDLDPTKLAVNAKPTIVTRGVAIGYSLPVGGADEELFYEICVPDRWDGESDIHCHIEGWLDTAQDEAADAAELTLKWEHFGIGGIVPATSNTVVDEVVTGIVAQYTYIQFDFVLDYDIDVGDAIEGDDKLVFHIVRSASSHEIAGEVVISHAAIIFQFDKLGSQDWR